MVALDIELERVIERALASDVVATSRVHGGDVAIAFAVDLAEGRRVFVKTHLRPPPEFFTTEATGLAWLAEASAVDVPRVLAVSDAPPAFLALEWIESGRPGPTTETDLGRRLARLHRAGAPSFGREDRRTTGSRALPNQPTQTWVEFYADNRLLPLAKLAREAGALPAAQIRDPLQMNFAFGKDRLLAHRGANLALDLIEFADASDARIAFLLAARNRIVVDAGRSARSRRRGL